MLNTKVQMVAAMMAASFGALVQAQESSPKQGTAKPPLFRRGFYVTYGWSSTPKYLDSEAAAKKTLDDIAYMNGDAIFLPVPSEYVEAVRDPTRKNWERHASWNMVEKVTAYAHSKGIQVHVWIDINKSESPGCAEQRLFGDKFKIVYRDGSMSKGRNDLAFKELFDYEIGVLTFLAKHFPMLDGIHLEEPFYAGRSWHNYHSYSTAMRERVKKKYGYDPLSKPEDKMKRVWQIFLAHFAEDGQDRQLSWWTEEIVPCTGACHGSKAFA